MNAADNNNELARISARIMGDIIRASGTSTLLNQLLKDLLSPWVSKGGIRSGIASGTYWVVSKILRMGRNSKSKGISADAGKFLTAWAKKVNADRGADAACDIGKRGEAIHSFLINTDFGEIREMVEGSDPYVIKTLEAFNEHLWKYPAKVGTLVATMIPVMNTSIKAIREILAPVEKKIGPDLLADIMLSVLKGINGADTAQLINSLSEVIRRVHTGSLLLGKGGKPLFQVYLTDLLHVCLSEMDPDLARKIRVIFAQDREAMANALADALIDNPGITLSCLASLGSVKTSSVKAQSRKLAVIEEIPRDGLKAALSEGMSDLDTYEIARLVNTACRVVNRIHDAKPDIVCNTMSGVVDSVDPEEVKRTFQWLLPDVVDAIKPLAAAVMPQLIETLSVLISPDDGAANPEHKIAMESLRTALASGSRG